MIEFPGEIKPVEEHVIAAAHNSIGGNSFCWETENI